MTNSKKTLDEKCWKGYKKKGMKTMFGKRYPNCVKVKKEGFSDWRSELEQIEEKTKLKNTDYGPAVVYQDNEKTAPARVRQQMPTGGDGTAYMGEKMDLKKADMGDVITDFRKSDAPQFKGKSDKKIQKMAIAAKLNAMEALDSEDVPVIKGIVKKLEGASKKHKNQALALKKAVEENTAIESELTIQDWNVDDIKFTEIETVDIIKAKPLKENKAKIIGKGLKMLGNLSKKTKIKSISPKPVATPGTTFQSRGKFPAGSFDKVPEYAGALPKPTKTGGIFNPAAANLKKDAFKGGGSLKGRIDPSTGNRISFKDYKNLTVEKPYVPVKGAKFGDKIMATKGKRQPFDAPLKQEKLPYPKPRTPDVKKSKLKVRDDATFGDQIMVRKNEPFSRNFIGRTPMPKPLGKAKYEVGKKGVGEFKGGDDMSGIGFRSFTGTTYTGKVSTRRPKLKKPASAPKDQDRLYGGKDGYKDYITKKDLPTTNPEAGRVIFGKGELKTGVKKKGKTIYKENTNIDEGFKTRMIAKLGKNLIKKIGKVNPFTKTGAQRVTQGVGSGKKYIPPSKEVVQNIQTKSVVNKAKKLVDTGKKPIKGTKPVKVDLSKPIDFDKYFGKHQIRFKRNLVQQNQQEHLLMIYHQ